MLYPTYGEGKIPYPYTQRDTCPNCGREWYYDAEADEWESGIGSFGGVTREQIGIGNGCCIECVDSVASPDDYIAFVEDCDAGNGALNREDCKIDESLTAQTVLNMLRIDPGANKTIDTWYVVMAFRTFKEHNKYEVSRAIEDVLDINEDTKRPGFRDFRFWYVAERKEKQ